MTKQNSILKLGTLILGQIFMYGAIYMLWLQIKQQWETIPADAWHMDAFYVIIALLSTLLLLVFMSAGWTVGLRAVGQPISLVDGFAIYYQTSILRYLPGAVWHFPSRAYLCQKRGIALEVVAKSVFLELFFLLGTGAMLACWGLSIHLKRPEMLLINLVIAATMAAVIFWPQRIFSIKWIKFQHSEKVNQNALLTMFGIYIAVWFFYGGAIASLLYSLPEIQQPPFLHIVFFNSTAWAFGFLSFSPAGLGARELSLSILLGPGLGIAAALVSVVQRVMELGTEGLLWVTAKLIARKR